MRACPARARLAAPYNPSPTAHLARPVSGLRSIQAQDNSESDPYRNFNWLPYSSQSCPYIEDPRLKASCTQHFKMSQSQFTEPVNSVSSVQVKSKPKDRQDKWVYHYTDMTGYHAILNSSRIRVSVANGPKKLSMGNGVYFTRLLNVHFPFNQYGKAPG